MVDDCYQCLTCIANRSEGRDAIISYRSAATLCTVVTRDLYGKRLKRFKYATVICVNQQILTEFLNKPNKKDDQPAVHQ